MRKQRFIFSVLLLSFLFGSAMIGTGLASLPPPTQKTETVILNPALSKVATSVQPENMTNEDEVENSDEDEDEEEVIAPSKPEQNEFKVKLKKGETIASVLHDHGVGDEESAKAMGLFAKNYNLKTLKVGSVFEVQLSSVKDGRHVKAIKLKSDITKNIGVFADTKGNLLFKSEEIKFSKVLLKSKGPIVGSFYQSALRAGVTPAVISQLIAALSYDVDFQRDLQAGNKFTVMFEAMASSNGQYIKSMRPLYVKVEMRKKTVEVYLMTKADGTTGYFHADGSNVKKALLRTPVDGARITSGFGMRFHPILGYTKMHKGVDFGAPTGTPIYAAGDGVIEQAGPSNGYGNFVLMRHNNTYETAYGHCSRFGAGIKPGVHVRQGQIIAYVGMTGRATGPHLHYEVRVNGDQVNPGGIKFAFDNRLTGKELAAFQDNKKRVIAALSNAPSKGDLAKLIGGQTAGR